MEKILIITGASRGIGYGIAKAYLRHGYRVISLARTINKELAVAGATQLQLDLSNIQQTEEQFSHIFELLNAETIEKITLINNAGTLGQIGPLEQLEGVAIAQTITLNTLVPFVCSAAFLRHTNDWRAKKSIINITSGAGQKPYFGWSAYCSSKAAINMLTQTLALEQASYENGAKVLAIAPGVVDTDMQGEIRQSTKANFRDIDRFLNLKAENLLNDIDTVGEAVYRIDHDETVESGEILRVEGKS